MAIPLSYNIRNVLQRPVSTFTTALGIGLTVAILIGALALAAGFRASLVSTGSPDNVLVLRKGADSEISSGLSRQQSEIIRSHPSIATGPDGKPAVSSELVVVVNKPRLGQAGSSNLTVRGVDAGAIAVRGKVAILAGRMFTPGTDEIIVGRRVAARFANCRIGDRIRFQQRDFTVVGHFGAGGSAFESEIWGDPAVLGPALDRDGFQTVVYRMKDPGQFDAIKKELEADPRLQVQVKREPEFYAAQSEMFTGLITGIGGFITAIMAIGAVFGAMNTMFATVGSRRREIATLLVLGFSPLSVMSSFVIESVFLSMIGGLIGCLLALPINGITTSTTNFQSFSEMAFAFRVTPVVLLSGFLFSVVLGVVGGFLPALRAGRQSLAATLRGV
jgi:ABC-type lipoprotein release transport system permease subunit